MKEIALGFAIGGWLLTFMFAVKLNEQDMKVCQLSHSFDTCHNALNR